MFDFFIGALVMLFGIIIGSFLTIGTIGYMLDHMDGGIDE